MKLWVFFGVILFLSLFSLNLFPQSIFLEKGVLGIFANGSYAEFENGRSNSFGGGLALGNTAELGFSFGNSTLEESNYYFTTRKKIKTKNLYLGIVLLEGKTEINGNIGYAVADDSPGLLNTGISITRKIEFVKNLSCFPTFSAGIGFPIGKEEAEKIMAVGLTVPVLIAEIVYVGPNAAISDGKISWGLIAGISLGMTLTTN